MCYTWVTADLKLNVERSKVFHFDGAAVLRMSKKDGKNFHPSESVFMLSLKSFGFRKRLLDLRRKVI